MVTLAIGKVRDSKCDRASKFWKIQVKLRDWGKIEAIAPFKKEKRRSCNLSCKFPHPVNGGLTMSLSQTLKTPKILSPQAFLLEELVFVANPNFLKKLTMTTITIQIDPDIAAAFQVSQPEQQQKIQTLINQWMRQALKISTLQNTMDKLSDEAEANGLTPEILQSILDE